MIELSSSNRAYNVKGDYVARIAGKDAKYTFQREFLGATAGIDEPGLYEICNIDKRGDKNHVYRVIAESPEGELIALRAGGDNLDGQDGRAVAIVIAKRLSAGESIEDIIEVAKVEDGSTWGYRLRTKAAAKKAGAAKTIGEAVDACAAILENLPEREAKAVLAALKARVLPPKPKAGATGATAEAGCEPAIII